VRSSRKKTGYLVGIAAEELRRTVKSGQLCFITLTFEENVQEKSEAMKRWHRLAERLRRRYPRLRGVGVWQRQQRGAWHLHLLVNTGYVPLEWFRPAAVACGFGRIMKLEIVGYMPGFREDRSLRSAVAYMVRYVTRDLEVEDGVAVVTYFGGARCGSVKFSWNGGLNFLYRRGCGEWVGMETGEPVRGLPFWFLVRVGWESLSVREQDELLCRDVSVMRWWTGPPGPGNSFEPF
jgi:hypothetical protein